MADSQKFLKKEYKHLWKEWGIDEQNIPSLLRRKKSTQEIKNVRTPKVSLLSIDLKSLEKTSRDCVQCGLCHNRNQVVFGQGAAHAKLMFVGEAPSRIEDEEGKPFQGRIGELLDKIISAMRFTRKEVYITNLVKCRTPEDRVPQPDEIEKCYSILESQIRAIQPRVIVALGLPASRALTGFDSAMSNLRGHFHFFPAIPEIQIMPTYHPAYLLRNPAAKKHVWEDMQKVMHYLSDQSEANV